MYKYINTNPLFPCPGSPKCSPSDRMGPGVGGEAGARTYGLQDFISILIQIPRPETMPFTLIYHQINCFRVGGGPRMRAGLAAKPGVRFLLFTTMCCKSPGPEPWEWSHRGRGGSQGPRMKPGPETTNWQTTNKKINADPLFPGLGSSGSRKGVSRGRLR